MGIELGKSERYQAECRLDEGETHGVALEFRSLPRAKATSRLASAIFTPIPPSFRGGVMLLQLV